ncbi:uncharacterized protein LOC125179072 [Hyalella azteca]|uniref:Uncharacterized protein LOC125179072 n=1 Tax=Hyalella azteca TaxID=294128 RepID=A0A979FUS7_HYAAZ|nr:uncharacterized protein LOC125179072 [Hyalella azteca]
MKRYVDTNPWTHRTNPDSYQPEGWHPPIRESFYTESLRLTDRTSPTIYTQTYTECDYENLRRHTCDHERWSATIVVADYGIGLQTVTTTPYTSVPLFPPMTRQVTLQYTASCCDPLLMVYATDVNGNSEQRAIGSNGFFELEAGAIAGIVIAVIALLALIIAVVLLLVRRWRSKRVNVRLQEVRTSEE